MLPDGLPGKNLVSQTSLVAFPCPPFNAADASGIAFENSICVCLNSSEETLSCGIWRFAWQTCSRLTTLYCHTSLSLIILISIYAHMLYYSDLLPEASIRAREASMPHLFQYKNWFCGPGSSFHGPLGFVMNLVFWGLVLVALVWVFRAVSGRD